MFYPKQAAGGGGGQNPPTGRFLLLFCWNGKQYEAQTLWLLLYTNRLQFWIQASPMGHALLSLVYNQGSYLGGGGGESTPSPNCTKFWKAWPVLGKRAQFDLFILKLYTWYDLLGANNTTCKTDDLIQSNRSVFLLLQNYSQAFFPIEISSVTFAAIFAGSHSTLTFDIYRKKKR